MYLFFVRDFNDIDHITPVVWKIAQDEHPVAVYCINPKYDIQGDYRLDFLRRLGIKVDFIYNDFDHHLGWLHRTMRFLFLRAFAVERSLASAGRMGLLKIFGQVAGTMGSAMYNLSKSKFYDTKWAHDILQTSGARAVCFDWIRPHKYVVKALLRAAQKRSIPSLALPHGVFLYTNDFVQTESKEQGQFDRYNLFDYVIVQNRLFKEVISGAGVANDKIFTLGSARYCNEWLAKNNEILPRKMAPYNFNAGKLKVVLMTTRPHYRVAVDKMLQTFETLSKIDGIEVVVKPHTRTGKEAHMYENMPLSNVSDVSSIELCEWADVVLVIASSIIIEALIRKKPALYLKYLHENTTEYEDFGACWIIHDDAELRDALLFLRDGGGKGRLPYTEENVNRWLTEIISGGQDGRDVLGDYKDFILNHAS